MVQRLAYSVIRRLAGCCLAAGGLCLPAAVGADESLPYFATISIERAQGENARLGDTIRSDLHVADTDAAAQLLAAVDGVDVIATGRGTVSIVMIERPTLGAPPQPQHRQASWVIDFDEEPVRQLVAELRTRRDREPTIDELVVDVFEHIHDKTYARSFDLASRIARTGEGDCTEHAVLLVALARAFGFPARVVTGNVILETESEVFAFGHAWSEVHDGERWQIHDATLPPDEDSGERIRYLPLTTLTDEGPGFGFAMGYAVNSMPSRITGLANPR